MVFIENTRMLVSVQFSALTWVLSCVLISLKLSYLCTLCQCRVGNFNIRLFLFFILIGINKKNGCVHWQCEIKKIQIDNFVMIKVKPFIQGVCKILNYFILFIFKISKNLQFWI